MGRIHEEPPVLLCPSDPYDQPSSYSSPLRYSSTNHRWQLQPRWKRLTELILSVHPFWTSLRTSAGGSTYLETHSIGSKPFQIAHQAARKGATSWPKAHVIIC